VKTFVPGLAASVTATLALAYLGHTVWLMWAVWGLSFGVCVWWYNRIRDWDFLAIIGTYLVLIALIYIIFTPLLARQ
jgi:hypothetical protein